VTGKFSQFYHGGVLPQTELVLAEAMRTQKLTLMLTPLQCTYLDSSTMRKLVSEHTKITVTK